LESSYFRIERLRPLKAIRFLADSPYYLLLICTKGTGTLAGEPFSAGQCWMIPAGAAEFEMNGNGSEWILSYKASEPASLLQECT
jgi:mannose-6-phosphate isomerase class I